MSVTSRNTALCLLMACFGACEETRGGFDVEALRFENGEASLEGSLYLPRQPGRHPAVVVVHGSGPDTRRGYQRYGEFLADRGIALLAYDKRGTGSSSGDWRQATFEDLARDALSGVEALRRHDRIAGVGLIGISQGGWVAPLAATLSDHVAFLITVSGPGVSPATQVLHHWANLFRGAGASPEQVREGQAVIEGLWEYALTREGWDSSSRALAAARSEAWFRQAADREGLWQEVPRPADLTWMTPWLKCKDFDPVPVWAQVRVPVLAIFGERDELVPVEPSVEAIRGALAGAARGPTLRVFPGADHGIRIDGRIAEGFLESLAEWISETAGGSR